LKISKQYCIFLKAKRSKLRLKKSNVKSINEKLAISGGIERSGALLNSATSISHWSRNLLFSVSGPVCQVLQLVQRRPCYISGTVHQTIEVLNKFSLRKWSMLHRITKPQKPKKLLHCVLGPVRHRTSNASQTY
jgi:hypothetical protein